MNLCNIDHNHDWLHLNNAVPAFNYPTFEYTY
jgi:hypothetical protein